MSHDFNELADGLLKKVRDLAGQRQMIDLEFGQAFVALRSLSSVLPERQQEIQKELKKYRRKPAGLTEAILRLLYHVAGALTANEIRAELEREGFDLSEYTQPLAVIFTTLRRLKGSGRVKARTKGGKRRYEWAGKGSWLECEPPYRPNS